MTDELKGRVLDTIHNFSCEAKTKFESIVSLFNSEFGEENVDGTWNIKSDEEWLEHVRTMRMPNDISCINKLTEDLAVQYGNTMTIIVRFPVVKVTNEEDRYTIIKDLYARILVNNGKLANYFDLQRTTFSKLHWSCGYAHSHLPGLLGWQSPCLGSGPISQTQSRLAREFDIELWGLFCYELSKYVTVESLEGVPYKRLESLGDKGEKLSMPHTRWYSDAPGHLCVISFFSKWLKTNTIKLGYVGGQYVLGEDPFMLWVRLSKDFIDWYNTECNKLGTDIGLDALQRARIIARCLISGRSIYKWGTDVRNRYSDLVPQQPVFTFKGEPVYVVVEDEPEQDDTSGEVYLLHYDIIYTLITKLYECANYNQRKDRDKKGSEETTTASREYKVF